MQRISLTSAILGTVHVARPMIDCSSVLTAIICLPFVYPAHIRTFSGGLQVASFGTTRASHNEGNDAWPYEQDLGYNRKGISPN